MGSLLRWGWQQFNSANQIVFGAGEYGILFAIIVFHLLLAIATLGLGDKTICEILRPFKQIFSIDKDSLLEGALDIGLAVPRAAIYFLGLYFRAYILIVRLVLGTYLALLASVLTVMLLMLVFLLLFGESGQTITPTQNQFGVLLSYAIGAYWYWRIDGKRICGNLYQSWQCLA
jgi:hypothetical protein